MLNKHNLIKRASRLMFVNPIRFSSKHKTEMEKKQRDPKRLTSNRPPLLKTAIYSEEEKLNLWKSLNHFELNPNFAQFSTEEQIKKQVGHINDVHIPGITKPKERPPEINSTDLPYNEIYEDGIDEGNFTKVQNLTEKQPQRWYWVERLFPKQIIKRDTFEVGKEYPTGLKIPSEVPNLPYFVARTRNHLLPVYKLFEKEDERVKTVIHKIDGDLWGLEQEIRTRLEAKYKKRILTSVNEVTGELKFLGNYVFDVVDYLEELGF